MGGCVLGPGENPLRPGEVAIRVGHCIVCKKKMPFGFPDLYGIEDPDDKIKYGTPDGTRKAGELCPKHISMATHRY